MECEFCKKTFSTLYVLKNHKVTTKSCLILQGKLEKKNPRGFRCRFCDKCISSNENLKYHEIICKNKPEETIIENDPMKQLMENRKKYTPDLREMLNLILK